MKLTYNWKIIPVSALVLEIPRNISIKFGYYIPTTKYIRKYNLHSFCSNIIHNYTLQVLLIYSYYNKHILE